MTNQEYAERVLRHYEDVWSSPLGTLSSRSPRAKELPETFRVAVFRRAERMNAYATISMSLPEDSGRLELHLLTRRTLTLNADLCELLASVTHYHRTEQRLGLGHTVNFGKPWLPGSGCTYGLISLPYLDGPKLEVLEELDVRFLWLLPITPAERDFKVANGLEALEERFEAAGFDYLDPHRRSVV